MASANKFYRKVTMNVWNPTERYREQTGRDCGELSLNSETLKHPVDTFFQNGLDKLVGKYYIRNSDRKFPVKCYIQIGRIDSANQMENSSQELIWFKSINLRKKDLLS